eukprot:scaffold10647_cov113-Isochrysis_galbana.AAC.2
MNLALRGKSRDGVRNRRENHLADALLSACRLGAAFTILMFLDALVGCRNLRSEEINLFGKVILVFLAHRQLKAQALSLCLLLS